MPPHVVEKLDLSHLSTAEQVMAVQRAAYREEADLIGSTAIPQLTESLAELQAQPLEWIGVHDSRHRVVAALAFTDDGEVIDIDRLMVAPNLFRRGYGRALVAALDERRTVIVSTGRDNPPGRALYESLGFVRSRDEEVVPGLVITHFRREAAR
jgi:GNAT superfamily N-acetyltransferase